MGNVGRNDPCTCGSGKKYKKCCMNKSDPPVINDQIINLLESVKLNLPQDYITNNKINTDFNKDAFIEWENLHNYEETRIKNLSQIFSDMANAIEKYEIISCKIVLILGKINPSSLQDQVLRDLFCEAFDCLRASKEYALKYQLSPIFTLIRRSFEIISLFVYFVLNPSKVNAWENGHQINQSEIKEFLANHPLGENKKEMTETYSYLSRGTHINRDFIGYRFLGQGNEFVLGSIGNPILLVVADHLIKIIDLWFWLIAVTGGVYSNFIKSVDKSYYDQYIDASKSAKIAVDNLASKMQIWKNEYAVLEKNGYFNNLKKI